MGLSPFKSCGTGYTPAARAPNPDPRRWRLVEVWQHRNAYVLLVRYLDATNFEGLKVMVYRGRYPVLIIELDPHFSPADNSPIARFRPDHEGIAMANELAARLPAHPETP